jgi:hypothetical protein
VRIVHLLGHAASTLSREEQGDAPTRIPACYSA